MDRPGFPDLATFLPAHVADLLARGPVPPVPSVVVRDAALLLPDATGFTALAEQLQSRGRQGAEQIAALVRDAFSPAARIVARWGGSIILVAGDALLAMFLGPDRTGRAHRAAQEIAESFRASRGLRIAGRRVRLRFSQTLHHGRVRELHLGDEGRRVLVLSGPAPSALASLEAASSAEELLVSTAARARLRREPPPEPRPWHDLAAAPRAALLPYVPPEVQSAAASFEGAFTLATVAFIETRVREVALLQRFVRRLLDQLDLSEGRLVAADPSVAGTKWLVAYGTPAHEDDGRRAAAAALEALDALPPGAARAGIHAGTVANVWVALPGFTSLEIQGDPVNTAARVCAHAPWGRVLVTMQAGAAMGGARTRRHGAVRAKGKRAPLELHLLLGVDDAPRSAAAPATPLVGRDDVVARLRAALAAASRGEGSALGLRGDPGVGKSRLKLEASRMAADAGIRVLEGHAVPFGGATLGPLRALVAGLLGLGRGDDRAALRRRLSGHARGLGLPRRHDEQLAELLGLRPAGSRPLEGDAARARAAATASILALLRAAGRPLLLVLEDLQWSDESTLEILPDLLALTGALPICWLLLYRRELAPIPALEEFVLADLPPGAASQLLAALLPGAPAALLRRLQELAGGNPLFAEELARDQLERRATGGEAGATPRTIESVILSRLDRLPPDVRHVLQVAAVVGRRSPAALLARLAGAGAAAAAIPALQERTLLFPTVEERQRLLVFKHALVRDVAYGSLLGAQRQRLHAEAAAAIAELYAGDPEPWLAARGHHHQLAGERAAARACYTGAFHAASRRHAHAEALRHVHAAIALGAKGGELVEALVACAGEEMTIGRSAAALRHARRGVEIARRVGPGPLVSALGRLAYVLSALGRNVEAHDARVEAAATARRHGSPRVLAGALRGLATSHADAGDFARARRTFARGLAISRRLRDASAVTQGHADLACVCALEGRWKEGRRLFQLALAGARRHESREFQATLMLNFATVATSGEDQLDEARELSERALATFRDLGMRPSQGTALVALANAEGRAGQPGASLRHYRQALRIFRDVGDRSGVAAATGNMAQTLAETGRLQEA